MSDSRPPLSLATKLFYAVGAVANAVKLRGLSTFLMLFYNQVVGLPPTTVTFVLMIALVFDAIAAGDSPLTAREADVLAAAGDGAPVEEIAARLHLSPGTVRNYLSSAMGKLHAATRHEAARVAREHGWA